MLGPLLIVDDEEGIRKVLRISLMDSGYRVLLAESGEHAWRIFKEKSPPIVLTDIKMPGMDGIELLRRIKAERPETEVIMMTGHGDMDLAVLSLKHEATDFVTKPISDDILEFALKRAWERILLRRQVKDYTDHLENLVDQKTKELILAERLAAVGQTIAGLSHAIKNVAGGLESGIYVIEKGLELDNQTFRTQGWEVIKRNVARIKNLSMDLLGYTKPATLHRTLVDPNQPAGEVIDLMRPKANEMGLTLVADFAADLPAVPLDAEGIHRCLLNLVTNAMEACQDEDEQAPGAEITLKTRPGVGGGVEYHISDNGPGMDPETRQRLFTLFFTTKGSRGTGLGLMVTRKIIEDHGGVIDIQTEPGQGTTFILRLPG